MSAPPKLTDPAALQRNRARARSGTPALFLHEEAILEVEERLNQVNRRFTRPAVVTGWPEVWAGAFPGARIVADGPRLDLAPETHDLIIHAMALHWADDPVGQLVQCRRALVPDGLLIAVLPGGRTLHELRASLAEAESAVCGGLSPRVLPMGEIRDMGGLLGRAGLALPVADAFTLTASYRDLSHIAHDLRAMGEGNALAQRSRRYNRPLFAEADRIYRSGFGSGDGRIAASYELLFLTGWAPHPDQQKPLRPGSALARLADALNDRNTTD